MSDQVFGPLPTNPVLFTEQDVHITVIDFLKWCAVPQVPAENIYRGYLNNITLPQDSNEYIIVTCMEAIRRGTNREELVSYDTETGLAKYRVITYLEVPVQVDFYSDTENARIRAQSTETMSRSSFGVNFFRQRGMSINYATGLRDLTEVDEEERFIRRFTLTLHVCYWSGLVFDLPYIDSVNINRIENVDVHHPPRENS